MVVYRPGLTFLTLVFLGFFLVLTWLLFSFLSFKTAENDLYTQKGEHARVLLTAFVSQLPEDIPVYPDDILAPDSPASVYIQNLSEEKSFIRLTLLDKNGKPVYSSGHAGSDVFLPFEGLSQTRQGSYIRAGGKSIVHVVNIVRNETQVGRAGLLMSLMPEQSRLARTRQVLGVYFILNFFLLLSLGIYILSKIVIAPINRLLAATEKITSGNYGQTLKATGSAELARLAGSFNVMSAALLSKEKQVALQMSALEKANVDIRQAREQAFHSEKMASIGLLAAGMAHEVGTPLAAIMGYAELLTEDSNTCPETRDYARRIFQECNRIDRLVRSLLDYSRPRVVALKSLDIPSLVVQTLDMLTQQGAFKKIKVSTYFEKDIPVTLGDVHQLQQTLVNLVLNSRDAMPNGGKLNVRVTRADSVKTGGNREYLRVDIIDNGMGIPQENIANLFVPFFTTKPPGKGTGLGLPIAARIIEEFGGKITVQSIVGRGSCFTLWLPAVLSQGDN